MNLNIQYLLNNLAKNTQEILSAIHNDPKLTHRQCPETGLWISNASKELFSPEKEHQLYAKGIIYKQIEHCSPEFDFPRCEYVLVALPLLKIYNHGENIHANTHVNEMVASGAEPVMTYKLDGTSVSRFVYRNKVYFATRGLIETMAENDDQRQYFKWTREIAENKYPLILDTEYLNAGTAVFELTGPGNQIVTYYPQWDLTMIAYTNLRGVCNCDLQFEDVLASEIVDAFKFNKFEYWPHQDLVEFCEQYNFAKPVGKLYAFGENLAEKIESINKLFSNTDDEGSVIQFERTDERGLRHVVGRIKAKTDTYRQLLKLMNGCNYEAISALIKTDLQRFREWNNFEYYLKSLGNANFPEELYNSYFEYYKEFWQHRNKCEIFYKKINSDLNEIIDVNNIKFDFGDNYEIIIDKKERKRIAEFIKNHKFSVALFACLDNKLTTDYVYEKILKTPSEANDALKILNCG